MILWGFMTQFLLTAESPVIKAAGMLIAAVLLWDVMFRSNIGVAVSFLEEMWSRNLAQLFTSPLRPYEWALSLLFISLVRTVIGVIPAALLAIPLYSYSIFDMGLPLIAFFMNLMIFGGAIGLAVSALVLRFGMGAESLAWVGIFLVAPISGIYYPIAILPDWLEPVAWALPSAHVFEGMRAVLADGVFHMDLFVNALMLNRSVSHSRVRHFSLCLPACPDKGNAPTDGGIGRVLEYPEIETSRHRRPQFLTLANKLSPPLTPANQRRLNCTPA